MFSDDPKSDPEGVLADYHRWLFAVARDLAWTPSDVDDIAQEGRIAMWRALMTFDGQRGSLPSWLTLAARSRMGEIARGRKPAYGHQAVRGHKEARVVVSLDSFDPETDRPVEEMFDLIDTCDHIERAYHEGEVAKALDALSPEQQQYVYLRFFCGLDTQTMQATTVAMRKEYPVLGKRWLWHGDTGARQHLARSLQHLQGAPA